MATQLRRYEIEPGAMDAFVSAWRRVLPIRARLGFRVEFAYVDDEVNEFVWAVSHDGDFEAADAGYRADPERVGIDPSPADFIRTMHLHMVRPATAVPDQGP